jgi:hypothetical protein
MKAREPTRASSDDTKTITQDLGSLLLGKPGQPRWQRPAIRFPGVWVLETQHRPGLAILGPPYFLYAAYSWYQQQLGSLGTYVEFPLQNSAADSTGSKSCFELLHSYGKFTLNYVIEASGSQSEDRQTREAQLPRVRV